MISETECVLEIPTPKIPTWTRGSRLKLAILASIGSKLATVVLQFLVLPLAIRALGAERYGVYAMLISSLGWITLVGVGISPSLTIAIAAARGNSRKEAGYLTSALCITSAICTVILAALGILVWRYGIIGLFGSHYVAYSQDIRIGLCILTSYLLTQLLLIVVEGAQSGYQEMHIIGFYGMLGQILATISLAIVVYYHAVSVVSLIVCLCVVPNIPRLYNSLLLIGRARTYLLPRPRHFSPQLSRVLVSAGMAFGLVGLGQFLRQECSTMVVGRLLGPGPVASYAIMLYVTLLASGIVTMQLGPLLPAITDAMANSDLMWIRMAWRRSLYTNMAYAITFGATLMVGGSKIVSLLYGPAMAPTTMLQIAIGLGFILQTWEINHHLVLFGLGCMWPTAVAFVLQNTVGFLLCLVLVPIYGAAGAAGAFCITSTMFCAWFLPYLLRKQLAKHDQYNE